jgi:hypothetical protein
MVPRYERWNALKDGYRRGSGHNGNTIKVVRCKTGGPAAGTWDRLFVEVRSAWQQNRADGIDGFRFAVFGEQWEGLA